MAKITLILSRHHESGRSNADELLKILRMLNPEVIFAEVRSSDNWSLEIKAIEKYREFEIPELISVDRYDVPVQSLAEIMRDLDRISDYAARASVEYQQLNEENNRRVYEHGFKHLNSDACTTLLARMSEIEEKTVAESGDRDLIRGLEWWQHSNQRREVEMVSNIYKYCGENVFDHGVFLVGAAHKMGIVREIEKYSGTHVGLINWNLAYGG